jgi:hypothetical protein
MNKSAFSALVVAVILGGAIGVQADPIRFNSLSYVGDAIPWENGARLTDNVKVGSDDTPPVGAIWTRQPMAVSGGFALTFQFSMSGGWGVPDPDGDPLGADGLAFVIQNSADGNKALGRGAGGLGYMYIPNSLAVEFDTFQNAAWYGDPNGNHISVQTRGVDINVPHHKCIDGWVYEGSSPWVPCSSDPSKVSVNVSRPLNDGQDQTAKIIYEPGNLQLFLNSEQLFSIPLDLTQLLDLPTGQAYIGFTAGDRNAFQNHDILSADFVHAPEPTSGLLLLTGLLAMGWAVRRRRLA